MVSAWPTCTQASIDSAVVSGASSFPSQPNEVGVTMRCIVTDNVYPDRVSTSWSDPHSFSGPTMDRCAVKMHLEYSIDNPVGGVHSHPLFTSPSEVIAGNGCHGATTPPSTFEMNLLNADNEDFSTADRAAADGSAFNGKPMYLITPTSAVKKRYAGTTSTL